MDISKCFKETLGIRDNESRLYILLFAQSQYSAEMFLTIHCLPQVHPVDQNIISDLRVRAPQECEDLITSSPFLKLSIPTRRRLAKALTVTLPLPPNPLRLKRPQTAVATPSRDVEARPATARPSSTQERKGRFELQCQESPQVMNQGPVAQSIVSLTSSLVIKMLTALVSTVSNSQVFLLEKKCE